MTEGRSTRRISLVYPANNVIVGSLKQIRVDAVQYDENLKASTSRPSATALKRDDALIWSSTSTGQTTYVSVEWSNYTGQPVEDALGQGWLRMLHPDDQEVTDQFFKKACASVAPFTVRYRLRRVDGTYAWVVVGATPSISPIDGSFLGYLGAISEDDSVVWSGELGASASRPPSPATTPTTPVDQIADHLLLARSIAAANGEQRLLASIDFALSEVMRSLGYPSSGGAQH